MYVRMELDVDVNVLAGLFAAPQRPEGLCWAVANSRWEDCYYAKLIGIKEDWVG